jgi:hypothetical protein
MTVTAFSSLVPEESSITAVVRSTYLPLPVVAAATGVSENTLRRLARRNAVMARPRQRGKGDEINVLSLPQEYRAPLIANCPEMAELFPSAEQQYRDLGRYSEARRASVRERAELRLEAARSFRRARAVRGPSETLAESDTRWLHQFRASHSDMKVSIRSVRDWCAAFDAHGIAGLIDGNDGAKQSGSRIPEPAKELFEALYFRSHRPNLTLVFEQVCIAAQKQEWGPMPSYRSFKRYADSFSPMFTALRRTQADSPRGVLPYVRRDPTSVPVYHTLQGDSRQLDVPVRCDQRSCKSCNATAKGKAKGHFPIWSIWIDTHSRYIVDWELTIEGPTARHVLTSARRMIAEHGLMKRLIVDNGGPYVSGLGRVPKSSPVRRELPESAQAHLDARLAVFDVDVHFTLPYNPQGKGLVESVFRTFRMRFDERFESFRGPLGRKSEKARELLRKPAELPTPSELAHQLQLAVDDYHNRPHGGLGMNGRTPQEVFSDESRRLPRVTPDGKAFALAFFEPVRGGRQVNQLGITYDGQHFRLDSLEKQFQYFGKQVDVRINPDNRDHVILLDIETGGYICDAHLDATLASYDARDEVTRKLIARTFGDIYTLRRMAERAPEAETQARLTEHAQLLTGHYEQLRDARSGDEPKGNRREIEAAVVLSHLSRVARARDAALADARKLLPASDVAELIDVDALSRWAVRDAADTLEPVIPMSRYCQHAACADTRLGKSGILCEFHEREVGMF